LSTGQKEKAAREFQSLLASKPKDLSVKASLIETLLDLNHIKEAQALNRELLASNASDPRALLSDGRILGAEGRYQEAAISLQKAIKSDPKSAAAHYFLGMSQKALGLLDQSKSSFAEAAKLAPERPESAVALA